MRDIVMIGPQGSGKGTQAERLAVRLGMPAIIVGRLLREEIENDTGLGRMLKQITERGDLVPPELVTQVVYERLQEEDASEGVIIDGYPRSVAQLESLDKMLGAAGRQLTDVVFIDISNETSFRRLSGRRVCSNVKCETNYHVEFNPPRQRPGHCDRCGSPLIQRKDDVTDAIKQRLELYHKETSPLVDLYRRRGILREVDGEQSIEKVEADIVAALSK